MYFIITLLTVITSICYLWIKKRFRYWKDQGFAQGDPSFPFGTLKSSLTMAETLDIYYKQFKQKESIVGLYNFLSPILLPIDPELIKNILVRDFQAFHDRAFFHNKDVDPLSANILTLEGQEWKDRRVKLSPIFTSGKMKMMFEIIDKISEKFVDVIEKEISKNDNLEIREWLQRLTMDNIANTAFGINPNCIETNSEFAHYSRKLFEQSIVQLLTFMFAIAWPDLGRILQIRFTPKDCGDYFLKTFVQAFEERETSKIIRNDFVSLLLSLKDVYTKEELAAEAFLVFSGGFETSSTLMTFTLYELALNPDIQERLREEIVTGIEENDGKLTYDLLFGFKYLDMVINESLRKYPPIPNHFRKSTMEYQIPNTEKVIPKGTMIIINAFSLQRDPQYFPNPDKFDPERFNSENVKKINSFTNLPFGDGPRNCLGMRFGLMQAKIGIVKILSNFVVSTCQKTPIPVKFVPGNPFLEPEGGMWLNLKIIE